MARARRRAAVRDLAPKGRILLYLLPGLKARRGTPTQNTRKSAVNANEFKDQVRSAVASQGVSQEEYEQLLRDYRVLTEGLIGNLAKYSLSSWMVSAGYAALDRSLRNGSTFAQFKELESIL